MSEQKLVCGMPEEWFGPAEDYWTSRWMSESLVGRSDTELNREIELRRFPGSNQFVIRKWSGLVFGVLEFSGEGSYRKYKARFHKNNKEEFGFPEAHAVELLLRDYWLEQSHTEKEAAANLTRQRRMDGLRDALESREWPLIAHQEIIDLLTKMSEALVEQNKKLDVLARSTHDIPRRMKNNEY